MASREQARAVAETVRARLSDPGTVVAQTGVPDATSREHRRSELVWGDLSLANGYLGLALLWAAPHPEGPVDPGRVHAYLSAASERLTSPGAAGAVRPQGLYAGVGAMALASLTAHRAGLGYTKALARTDALVAAQVRHVAAGAEERRFVHLSDFDVTRGLTGTGRYLLARGESLHEELRVVLRALVRMTEPVGHQGTPVPGLWTLQGPRSGPPEEAYRDGHLNLGLAHGIAGPLSLLSLAHHHGVVVEHQEEAVERLARVLLDFVLEDAHGVYWPRLLTLDEWRAGTAKEARSRPSWCYGAPGVTRALQLAADALDRPDWRALAHRSLLSLLSVPAEESGIEDAGLCHGWAGLLHLLRVCNRTLDDPRLTRFEGLLADRVLAAFDPELPFGFRAAMHNAPRGADAPGFLDGAAGIALALQSYAEGDDAARAAGAEPANWEAALLIS